MSRKSPGSQHFSLNSHPSLSLCQHLANFLRKVAELGDGHPSPKDFYIMRWPHETRLDRGTYQRYYFVILVVCAYSYYVAFFPPINLTYRHPYPGFKVLCCFPNAKSTMTGESIVISLLFDPELANPSYRSIFSNAPIGSFDRRRSRCACTTLGTWERNSALRRVVAMVTTGISLRKPRGNRCTINIKEFLDQGTSLGTSIWLCLKIGYPQEKCHLLGKLIINHWV